MTIPPITLLAAVLAGTQLASAAVDPVLIRHLEKEEGNIRRSESRNAVMIRVTEAERREVRNPREHEILNRIEGHVDAILWSLDGVESGDQVVVEWTVRPREEGRIDPDERPRPRPREVKRSPSMPSGLIDDLAKGESEGISHYVFFDVVEDPVPGNLPDHRADKSGQPRSSGADGQAFRKFFGAPAAYQDSFRPPYVGSYPEDGPAYLAVRRMDPGDRPVFIAYQTVSLKPVGDEERDPFILQAGEAMKFFGFGEEPGSLYLFDRRGGSLYLLEGAMRPALRPLGRLMWPRQEDWRPPSFFGHTEAMTAFEKLKGERRVWAVEELPVRLPDDPPKPELRPIRAGETEFLFRD